MLVNICMKFHEDILNGFQVTERTRFCDGQTDVRTDRQMDRQMDRQTNGRPGQKKMFPNPKGGRHNYLLHLKGMDLIQANNTKK